MKNSLKLITLAFLLVILFSGTNVTGKTYITQKNGNWDDKYSWLFNDKPAHKINQYDTIIIKNLISLNENLLDIKGVIIIMKDAELSGLKKYFSVKENGTILLDGIMSVKAIALYNKSCIKGFGELNVARDLIIEGNVYVELGGQVWIGDNMAVNYHNNTGKCGAEIIFYNDVNIDGDFMLGYLSYAEFKKNTIINGSLVEFSGNATFSGNTVVKGNNNNISNSDYLFIHGSLYLVNSLVLKNSKIFVSGELCSSDQIVFQGNDCSIKNFGIIKAYNNIYLRDGILYNFGNIGSLAYFNSHSKFVDSKGYQVVRNRSIKDRNLVLNTENQ